MRNKTEIIRKAQSNPIGLFLCIFSKNLMMQLSGTIPILHGRMH